MTFADLCQDCHSEENLGQDENGPVAKRGGPTIAAGVSQLSRGSMDGYNYQGDPHFRNGLKVASNRSVNITTG